MLKAQLLTVFSIITSALYSQSTKITWEDMSGREFSITAPDGRFNYTSLSSDVITYNQYGALAGLVSKIGPVNVEYYQYGDLTGKIKSIGYTYVEYEKYGEFAGRVKSIGHLTVLYEEYGAAKGKFKGTTGRVTY